MESLETSSQSILRNWYDTENRTPQMHYVNNAFKAWAISTTNTTVATAVSFMQYFCCKKLFNVDKAAGVPQHNIRVTMYCVKKICHRKHTKPQSANFIELHYLILRPLNLIVLSPTQILYTITQNSFNQRSRNSTELCIL